MADQPKYTIREDGPASDSSNALSALLNDWLRRYGGELVKSCGNCKNMNREGAAFCTRYGQTPPIGVIMTGCPSHDDTHEIPF